MSGRAASLLDGLRAEGVLPRATLDEDYNARATVSPERFEREMRRYRALSEPARVMPGAALDVIYDTESGQALDIFGAAAPGQRLRPVFLFIHGGYWRALSKADSAFMAPMLDRHGVATAVLDYRLAPAASLAEIVREVRAAVAFLWRRGANYGIDPQRIFVGGSSAGGHLTGAVLADGWQEHLALPQDVVKGALPISGLFHLAPIAGSFVQEWIQLSPEDVVALSPAEHVPRTGCPLVVAFASGEPDGFGRQSRAFDALWRAAGFRSTVMMVPDRNHFDVVLDLADDDSALSLTLRGLIAGG
ncbi:alpha/beta hydrolase fold domain-containing protein [Nitratireductor sp. CAU 1489]|uniref:Alpha/beta hydrolase fold domain-containing protein n=1 Tax=Nitratireductor arenosus TaxID=2682096 RepID=A0A844QHS1_9HYPH|nr:alpha/beta hydrolase [Nitratireductor arenosus]MVA99022.1 alpha/beta hydrolase fold domain-containing protein [Nitratireductor arenosus]